MIIGTVSCAGSAAAFFSAALRRASRFSWAITRSPVAIGVPYYSDCSSVVTKDFTVGKPVRIERFS
jgi:hypothetical protein